MSNDAMNMGESPPENNPKARKFGIKDLVDLWTGRRDNDPEFQNAVDQQMDDPKSPLRQLLNTFSVESHQIMTDPTADAADGTSHVESAGDAEQRGFADRLTSESAGSGRSQGGPKRRGRQ